MAAESNSDELLLRVDPLGTSVAFASAHEGKGSGAGAARLKSREGCDIILYPLSYWALGEKVGERLRGVRGGGLDVVKRRFIQGGEFLAWWKMKWFVSAGLWILSLGVGGRRRCLFVLALSFGFDMKSGRGVMTVVLPPHPISPPGPSYCTQPDSLSPLSPW